METILLTSIDSYKFCADCIEKTIKRAQYSEFFTLTDGCCPLELVKVNIV